MELGKRIAKELELDARGEVLSHWLAHHVAGLIHAAENPVNAQLRKDAEDRAVATILKIWEHRGNAPGQMNPLARYKEAVQTLLDLELRPHRILMMHLSGNAPSGGTARMVYDRLLSLIHPLFLYDLLQSTATAGERHIDPKVDRLVRRFLDVDEALFLDSLEGRNTVPNADPDGPPPDLESRLKQVESTLSEQVEVAIAELRRVIRTPLAADRHGG
ncbi:MAG: hypothetical protein U0Q16_25160 [Bryobacteraceae bacterium]